jgi:AAA15 family ATPase/GTPase
MIKKIHIQNFKSIVDLELELGNLNVFIGENGAGKTNILEGITFSGGAFKNRFSEEYLIVRGIRGGELDMLKSLFKKDNNSITFRYSDKKNKTIELVFLCGQFYGWTIIGNLYFEQDLDTFLTYAPENYFLRRFEEEGQIRPLGIRGEGLFKHLVDIYKHKPELLTKISENLRLISWFKDFEIPKDLMFTERRINIKDKYLAELDFFDQKSANEGFLYLLFYFTLFISPFTPPFFAIDNIDNALNPKLCAELIRRLAVLAKENNKQVLLTTHNPAVLDGLDLEDENQKLFTVYRNQEGHTKVKNIKPLKKVEGVEPVRLSEAFIRGYLGGLPKNF